MSSTRNKNRRKIKRCITHAGKIINHLYDVKQTYPDKYEEIPDIIEDLAAFATILQDALTCLKEKM